MAIVAVLCFEVITVVTSEVSHRLLQTPCALGVSGGLATVALNLMDHFMKLRKAAFSFAGDKHLPMP